MKALIGLSALMPMAALAAAAILTADPLTNLPLDPATSVMGMGNDPQKLPTGTFCKSKMDADVYTTAGSDVLATNAWYAAHLPGFKHAHGYRNGRSSDAYYTSDGTNMVSITGEPGADGAKVDTHTVIYLRFTPGLSEKQFWPRSLGRTGAESSRVAVT